MAEGVQIDPKSLHLLVRALRSEADGKELRRDLIRGLRAVAEPAAMAARGAILSMGTGGVSQAEPGLRTSVAAATKVVVRTGKNRPGVAVRVKKNTMPRGFRNAPKRLQSKKGWRHPVFGNREIWVTQRGKPGWFDDTLRKAAPEARAAMGQVLENVARRISARTRG